MYIKTVLLSSLLLFSVGAQAQVKNYFVNGVGNGFAKTYWSGWESARFLKKRTGLTTELLYNWSYGTHRDLPEAALMAINADHFYNWGKQVNPNYWTGNTPLRNARENLREMLRKIGLTADNWGNIYGQPSKVNLIGHSQGSLFVNRIAKIMEYVGHGNRVKVMTVASPDSFVYGGNVSNDNITLVEDVVARSFPGSALNPNWTGYYGRVRVDRLLTLGRASIQIALQRGNGYTLLPAIGLISPVLGINQSLYGDMTGHGFKEVYMKSGAYHNDFIVGRYRDNYFHLKFN